MKPEQKYIDAGIYKLSSVNVPWLDKPVESYEYDLEKLSPMFNEFFWLIGNISDQKYNIEKRSFERFEEEYDQHEYIDYLKEERKKALNVLNEKKKWLVPYENKSIINFIAAMGDEYLMGYFTKSEASPIYFDKLEVYRDLIEAETARKVAKHLKQRIEPSRKGTKEQRTLAYYYYYRHDSKELEYFPDGKERGYKDIARNHGISSKNFQSHYRAIESDLTERTNPAHHQHLLDAISMLSLHPKAKKIAEDELKLMELKIRNPLT